jgi:hypothetical protein
MLNKPTTPFIISHAEAIRMGRIARQNTGAVFFDLLRGRRSLRYPVMSILVSKDLGPCRHALAQRVVAGTMHVHFPFEDRESNNETEGKD